MIEIINNLERQTNSLNIFTKLYAIKQKLEVGCLFTCSCKCNYCDLNDCAKTYGYCNECGKNHCNNCGMFPCDCDEDECSSFYEEEDNECSSFYEEEVEEQTPYQPSPINFNTWQFYNIRP